MLGGHFISGLIVNHSVRRHQYRRTNNIKRISVCNASPKEDEEDISNDESIDQQKLALENMLNKSGGTDATTNKNSAILTSSRKQRLLREIELIKQLDPEHPENNIEYSDVQNQELVVSQLWALWYGERGPLNEMKLREVEDTLVDPNQWPDAEKKYLELIKDHCSTDGSMDNLNLSNWVEPANRLATLLFLMGRFSESKEWCDQILKCKPWHIGALSGVVMVCMKMGDRDIIKYSLMGLPNLTPQLRDARKDWVKKNVDLAEKHLRKLEDMNKESYGDPDDTHRNYAEEMPSCQEDSTEGGDSSDAWQ